MRYAWDLYHQYIKEAGLATGLKGMWAKYILHKMRLWDLSTVNRVNYFIANSEYIAKRIKKVYNRDASVIYPPVDVNKFSCEKNKESYYVAASRFVPYKKMDIVIQAFTGMPDKKLIVIGDGPDAGKLKSIAGKNIELVGFLNSGKMKEYFQKAKALVFAAEEDFGITVVEAHACGTPVIALNKGGTAETVIHGKNGIHFSTQTSDSIKEAVKLFESLESKFDPEEIRKTSLQYSRENFEKSIKDFIEEKASGFFKQ
jgi:glycosyltransferase involved in cell wall biosynthesis